MKLSSIKTNPGNPRLIKDDKFNKLVKSIKDFPKMMELRPIIVDDENIILGGNMRYKALQELKMKDIPDEWVKKASDLTDEEKKQFIIKDNVGFGEWNYDQLANDWNADDLDRWGLDIPSFDADPEQVEAVEDDYEIPDTIKTDIVLGDLFEIGQHRLLCGDSTKIDDVEKLMDGHKADMVFTDPPYGMKKEAEGVLNDNLNYDDLLEFNKQWIPLTFDALKDNGSWYCWGIDEPLMDIYSEILKPMARKSEITFRNLITWNKFHKQKPTAIEMMRSYCVYDEKCLFVMCGVQGFSNNSDNYFEEYEPIRSYLEQEAKKANINAKNIKGICGVGMYSHWFTKSQWDLMTEEHYKIIQNYCIENGINAFGVEFGKIKKQYDEIKKQWYETRAYFNNTHETYMTEVWDFETANEDERELTGGHATPKPIALCSRAIKSSSREGEIVLDFFGGSGSTLIACEQLNRTCYMMELDPKYCQVIIDRMLKLDPTLEIKRNGEKYNRETTGNE